MFVYTEICLCTPKNWRISGFTKRGWMQWYRTNWFCRTQYIEFKN